LLGWVLVVRFVLVCLVLRERRECHRPLPLAGPRRRRHAPHAHRAAGLPPPPATHRRRHRRAPHAPPAPRAAPARPPRAPVGGRRSHRSVRGARAPVRQHRGGVPPGSGRPGPAGRAATPAPPLRGDRVRLPTALRAPGGLQPPRRRGGARASPGSPRTPRPLPAPPAPGAGALDGDLRRPAPLPAPPPVARWLHGAAAAPAGAARALGGVGAHDPIKLHLGRTSRPSE